MVFSKHLVILRTFQSHFDPDCPSDPAFLRYPSSEEESGRAFKRDDCGHFSNHTTVYRLGAI
jgi:hypothetical protein